MAPKPGNDWSECGNLNPQDFLDYLAVERGASEHTVAAYRRDLRRYVAYLQQAGISQLAEVNPLDMESYVQALAEGFAEFAPYAPASVRRALAAARSWHRYALDNGLSKTNPGKMVKPSKPPQHLPTVLSVAEVHSLLQAAGAPGNAAAIRDRALLEFLYATGARISEAMNLALDDLNLDEELPIVRLFGKGRKERLAIVGSQAKPHLEAYLVRVRPSWAQKGKSQGRVFLNTLGKPLSRQSAWAIIQGAARRAGITRHISPHTLRHCFATHMLAGGADVRAVQEFLGHASVTTTQIYTKVTNDMLREVYASTHPRAKHA